MLETNRYPAAYAYLLQEDLTGSVYGLLRNRGVEAAHAMHEISLSYANVQQAKLLQLDQGDALLHLNEVMYDQHGRPLHSSKQYIRGDRFTFRL